MSDINAEQLVAIASRQFLESFGIESCPAFFETQDGKRALGTASVNVTRSSVTIRFSADDLVVQKAGYGESNGKIGSIDGVWIAPKVNDAGLASDGTRLFGAMDVVTNGPASSSAVAMTRLVVAGASWPGEGKISGRRVIVHPLSRDVVNHHDRRLGIAIACELGPAEIENIGRSLGFVDGLDIEILRVETYSADGLLTRIKHSRGYRNMGRGPHSPFVGVADDHKMRAFTALASAFPGLLKDGIPIDHIADYISLSNVAPAIHVGSLLLLMGATTAAYQHVHEAKLDSGADSRRQELARLNADLHLGLSDADLDRFEKLRVELGDAGFFHKPGYETGRPQQDVKFIRDVSHVIVFRLCGYAGPYYGAEHFKTQELAEHN